MMLGEKSESATYWKQCGDEAIANDCKGIIIMVRPDPDAPPPFPPNMVLIWVFRAHIGMLSAIG